jgi:hypothetical protein
MVPTTVTRTSESTYSTTTAHRSDHLTIACPFKFRYYHVEVTVEQLMEWSLSFAHSINLSYNFSSIIAFNAY